MVHDLDAWDRPDPPVFALDRSLIPLFSPCSRSIPEIRSAEELRIARCIYSNSLPLLSEPTHGASIEYGREYHTGDDAGHFQRSAKIQSKGFCLSSFDDMVDGARRRAFPLYQGRMIRAFDCCSLAYLSGQGANSIWGQLHYDNKRIIPQYYLLEDFVARSDKVRQGLKIAAPKVARATDERTMECALLVALPTVDSLNTAQIHTSDMRRNLSLAAILNSFPYDFILRSRLAGINMSRFIISETPFPEIVGSAFLDRLALDTACLTLIHRRFAPDWLCLLNLSPELHAREWKHWWAVTEADRLRLRVEIDALCADLYGLAPDDFDWIVRDDPTDPKGFWRVDKQLPYEQRLTGLAARAFRALKEGNWSAETVGELTNDQFFELLGIPELTSESAAKKKGYDRPLIYNRDGCHRWHPELFPEDDPRHGWTWEHCRNDAVALLGSEQAVRTYVLGDSGEGDKQKERPKAGQDMLF